MSEAAPTSIADNLSHLSVRALKELIRKAEEGDMGLVELLADELDEAVFVVDNERNVLLFNRRAEALTGFSRREVLGRHCLAGVKCTRCLEKCSIFDRGQVRGVPLELIRKDGSNVNIVKSATVLRDRHGEVIGALELFREQPEEVAASDDAGLSALQRDGGAWSGLEALMDALGRAFLVLDHTFSIERASAGFAELLGTSAAALAGRPVADALGEELFGADSAFRTALSSGQRREGWRAVARRIDGTAQPLSVTGAPLPDEQRCDGEAPKVSRFLVVVRPEAAAAASLEGPGDAVLFEGMAAASPAMHRVFQLIDHLRDSDASVLITGDSGTGKELVARAIHARSARANQPFVAVNCGALPANLLESELFGHARGAFTGAVRDRPGRFEVAGEGTIFLDEIGDLPLPLQVKLLRVLQERSFERVGESRERPCRARVVAATHQDLEGMVRTKEFREDLFYRLNVVPIGLPPLRERREDLELLITHLLDKSGRRRQRALRLSPSAMRALMTHDWPGNVRQLENALEYATAVCAGQTIHREDLPREISQLASELPEPTAAPPGEPDAGESARGQGTPSDAEVVRELERARFRRAEAARALGISRTTLWRRMKALQLL